MNKKASIATHLSPDAKAIFRDIGALTGPQTSERRQKAPSDEDILDRVELTRDLAWMAGALANPVHASVRFRAIRALAKRVGKSTARHLIDLTKPSIDQPFKLTLAHREDADLPDGGQARRERAKAGSAAAMVYLATGNQNLGMRAEEARDSAREALGKISSGDEGTKKAIREGKKGARQRGYILPAAPEMVMYFGLELEPDVLVESIRDRGRPKKSAS
ncbi:MAG: hypothetical protein J0J06_00410 [Sphingomonas sp.]|uniref:hypothetical protein n=1 Tax=Sphingomonas sp. TaxID=28214 RepID=UPI001AC5CC61|nr:hypothetical protein [Sphingomonas sp.]MBN8813889.1 hypothetical protein [Sphingomonas sp.]